MNKSRTFFRVSERLAWVLGKRCGINITLTRQVGKCYNYRVILILIDMSESSNLDPEFEADYKFIRRDIIKVAVGNLVFLGLLVGLYFVNQKYAVLKVLEKLF